MIALHLGDALAVLRDLPDASVDMVLADPPYGATRNAWDVELDMPAVFAQLRRVARPRAAIVMTAVQPFASRLVLAAADIFRYDLVWKKSIKTGFLNAAKMPLRGHELVLVFYREAPVYHPRMSHGHAPVHGHTKQPGGAGRNYGATRKTLPGGGATTRHPSSVIEIPSVGTTSPERAGHPTQKPVALMRYLVETYTDPGAVVLDFCMGAGSTGVACAPDRGFVGIEVDPQWVEVARRRIAAAAGVR